eukprot:9944247-Ditylum_brightwellii.AAC.1
MLYVGLIGLYHIPHGKGSNKTMLILYCITMINPATGWFGIKETTSWSSNVVANIVAQTWLTRYPWPKKVILDRGMEFMKDLIALMRNKYGIE